jgi:ABC-2 type transport system ATP-binding protein
VADPVISVRGLRKSYEGFEAVKGIDLEVDAGEVFAFLGPNGAGKTTTVEILEGYRDRNAGAVSVLGMDPASASRSWRERIGVVLQECRLTPELTVREALEQYAGYYPSPRSVSETVALVGLQEKAEARTSKLSGGQQRRLDVALALVGDPDLLFLDEPTTGFDPAARRRAWDMITSLGRLGKTVFLTTHYMEEAQALADRVAILAHGTVVASGAPDQLSGDGGPDVVISFGLPAGTEPSQLPAAIAESCQVDGRAVSLTTDAPLPLLDELTSWAMEAGIDLPGLEVRRPNLEDIYLRLVAEAETDEPRVRESQ